MIKLNTKTISTFLISLISVNVSYASQSPSKELINKDMNSSSVIAREIKVGEKIFNSTFFSRPSKGNYKRINNADFVQLWHGKDQSPYVFLNLSGLTSSSKDQLRRIMFFGLELTKFDREEALRLGRLSQMIKRPYEAMITPRVSLNIGYDLGVASAYASSCETNSKSILLSSGGLFEKEQCKPQNTKVLYSINIGDKLFPWDTKTSFTSSSPYSLAERLDGIQSVERLKDLLGCNSSPMISDGYASVLEKYNCSNSNEFVVLKNQSNNHQWNGYKHTDVGSFNQYGAPFAVPMSNWIKQEFDIE